MQLKIISLNLAGFQDWEQRYQKIVDVLNHETPDVVLLQEVRFDSDIAPYSQSELVNRVLSSSFPFMQTTVSKYYQPSEGSAYREGLAILSKHPIASSETLALTKQPDDKHTRIIQMAELSVNDQFIDIANIHLSNNQYSSQQLRELLNILSKRGKTPIIAGDFNIFELENERTAYEKDYTASIEFQRYTSFPSKNLTLDYALIPKGCTYEALTVIEGLSDHNALLFVVKLPELLS